MNPDIVDSVMKADDQRRDLWIVKVEELRRQANTHANEIKMQGKPTPEQIEKRQRVQKAVTRSWTTTEAGRGDLFRLNAQIPNPAADDVPVGKDETGNVEIFKWGEPKQFEFRQPKTHAELAEQHDLFDTKRGVKIAGNRAYFS